MDCDGGFKRFGSRPKNGPKLQTASPPLSRKLYKYLKLMKFLVGVHRIELWTR
jgi:hypothetical protein